MLIGMIMASSEGSSLGRTSTAKSIAFTGLYPVLFIVLFHDSLTSFGIGILLLVGGLATTRMALADIRFSAETVSWPTWLGRVKRSRSDVRASCEVTTFRFFKVSGWVLAIDGPHRVRRAWSTATDDRSEVRALHQELTEVLGGVD